MGPVWDFDGALDNGSHTLTDYNYIVMKQRPWFECMIQDPVFVNKLCDRYKELRKGILSDENFKEKATEGLKFLGNAIERDSVRWGTEYEASSLDEVVEKSTGLLVQRDCGNAQGEVQRIIDFAALHASYLDQHLYDIYVPWDGQKRRNSGLGILFIIAFFVSIILVQRAREGLR